LVVHSIWLFIEFGQPLGLDSHSHGIPLLTVLRKVDHDSGQ
jgi:hypothetical protein